MVSKSSSGTFATLGSNIGSETKTLSVDNLPSHNHTFTGSSHTHSVPAHSHGLNNHKHSYSKSATTSGGHSITLAEMPKHRFWSGDIDSGYTSVSNTTKGLRFSGNGSYGINYVWVGSGTAHKHGITLSSANTGAASGNTANSSALTSGGTTQGGTIGNTGKGTALSVVQNSKVCIRWHRIS